MKVCNRPDCEHNGIQQPITNFYPDPPKKDGYNGRCKDCSKRLSSRPEQLERNRTNYAKNAPAIREKKNKQNYRWLYGVEYEEIERMMVEQDNKCAICNCRPTNGKRLALDHNHDTGQIRKLLCYSCNFTIGLAKENTEILQKAIDYLNYFNNAE